MRLFPSNRGRWVRLLAVALAGGILPASCTTRVKDIVVTGTQNYISSLLNPALYLGALEEGSSISDE